MVQANEQELLNQAKRGEEAALAALVHRYQTAVLNVAYRLLGNRQDAEDAAQEAFVRAFQALDRFDEERPFAPWIKRIAANHCLNRLEAAKIRPFIPEVDLTMPGETAVTLDKWAESNPTPEQALLAQEQAGRIRLAIVTLPPRYRAVIELRHFQQLSYEEMAVELERPLSSIKSDLFRARKMLAEKLRETGGQRLETEDQVRHQSLISTSDDEPFE
jgi:RNA polymerase sigma-70 factor, ECF subfamily